MHFHALFTAMATTIGMGNVVAPSLAIMIGGPGAMFWLLAYMFLGSVVKFAEVSFALATREKLSNGFILGGPIQYLKSVSNLSCLLVWVSYCCCYYLAGKVLKLTHLQIFWHLKECRIG